MIRRDPDGSGYNYPTALFSKKHFEKVKKLKAEPGDVYIATYPKSGTHFSGQLVLQVLNGGEAEFDNFHDVVGVLEFEALDDSRCKDSTALGINNVREVYHSEPAVIATHFSIKHIPYSDDAKYIIMMRNPVDQLASLIKMMTQMMGPRLAPDVETFYDVMFGEDLNNWAQYNLDFWQKRNQSNYLFLFYEDAVKDTRSTVKQIANFLGRSLNPEAVEKVIFKSSIEYMKPNAKMFEPPKCVEFMPFKNPNRNLGIINKGKSGKGKDFIPQYIRERVKAKYLETFQDTDFPIERYLHSI